MTSLLWRKIELSFKIILIILILIFILILILMIMSLGDRMKGYETVARTYVDKTLPVVIRIDGHKFSKFTSGLHKPYDERFHQVMVEVTTQLVDDYNAVLGYTQSDEISLFLMPMTLEDNSIADYAFSNQVQKFVSLVAANATQLFINELRNAYQDNVSDYSESTQLKLRNPRAYFDARIFNVSSVEEAFNVLYWRSTHDCIRNSISLTAYVHLGHEAIQNRSCLQLLTQLLVEKQINWEDMDPNFKYGTLIKKFSKLMPSVSMEPNTESTSTSTSTTTCLRHQIMPFCMHISDFSDDLIKFLFSRKVPITDLDHYNLMSG